jgi:hypothetical protein
MRKRRRVPIGLKNAALEGFLLSLKSRAQKEGAFPLILKAGGISEAQLHAWAVGNGLVYSNGILAMDRRVAPQAGPRDEQVNQLAL